MQLVGVLYWLPILYIVIINVIAFLAMWWDKRKAVKSQWRVAEVPLHLLGIVGGAVGIFGGMYKLHHKTKKRHFRIIAVFDLIISFIIYWFIGMLYI